MKRSFIVILASIIVMSSAAFAGCGNKETAKEQASTESVESVESVESSENVESSESVESSAEAETTGVSADESSDDETKSLPAAGIELNGNTEYYDDFASAVDPSNWKEGSTLTLMKDVEYNNKIDVTMSKNLDLNGHKLTLLGSGSTEISVSAGKFTIKDSGTDGEMITEASVHMIDAVDSGELIINGGTLTGNGTQDYALIGVGKGGTVTFNDGTLRRTDSNAISMSGGTVNLDGGHIECSGTNSDPGIAASVFIWGGAEAVINWTGTEITTATSYAIFPGDPSALSALNLMKEPKHNGKGIFLREKGIINITDALSNTAPISVAMDNPGVFTSGLSGNGKAENFVSEDESLKVVISETGEAMLVK